MGCVHVVGAGLGPSLVDPALAFLGRAGAEVRFNTRLRSLGFEGEALTGLVFAGETVDLDAGDRVVLALPPAVAGALVPGLEAPADSRPIVNAHIRLPEAPALPDGLPFLGVVGGSADWIFLRGDMASLTVSAAQALVDEPAEAIADKMWRDTAAALGLDPALRPPVRVIKEKRATFAQTPMALKRRARARTAWRNLFLAGDWTDTGYPATIEGAVRSGGNAARAVLSN